MTRYVVHYALKPLEAGHGLVIASIDGAYLRRDGSVRAEDFDPAEHLHPLEAMPAPRGTVHRGEVRFGPDAPAGEYVWTIHRLLPDGTPDPEDPSLTLPMTWYHDPTGGRNAYGEPSEPVQVVQQQNHFHSPPLRSLP